MGDTFKGLIKSIIEKNKSIIDKYKITINSIDISLINQVNALDNLYRESKSDDSKRDDYESHYTNLKKHMWTKILELQKNKSDKGKQELFIYGEIYHAIIIKYDEPTVQQVANLLNGTKHLKRIEKDRRARERVTEAKAAAAAEAKAAAAAEAAAEIQRAKDMLKNSKISYKIPEGNKNGGSRKKPKRKKTRRKKSKRKKTRRKYKRRK